MQAMIKNRARKLRKNMTDVERLLWRYLRNRQLGEWKFRRQHAIGPFIVDFVCVEKKLVIEADGGQHAQNLETDNKRSEYLREKGYQIIRFWNHEILQEPEAVLNTIFLLLSENISPHPIPLPKGEGEL